MIEQLRSLLLEQGYDISEQSLEKFCDRFGITEINDHNVEFIISQIETAKQSVSSPTQETTESTYKRTQVIDRVKSQIYDSAIAEADQISSLIINQPQIVQDRVVETVQQHRQYLTENPSRLPTIIHLAIVTGQKQIASQNMVVCVIGVALLFFTFLTFGLKSNEPSTNQNRYERIY